MEYEHEQPDKITALIKDKLHTIRKQLDQEERTRSPDGINSYAFQEP